MIYISKGEFTMYDAVIKEIREALQRGGDDFEIIERASIRSQIPRIKVKAIYDLIKVDDQREAS